MARGFGSTLGSSSTDQVATGYTTGLSGQKRTYAFWLYVHGSGGSALGRFWDAKNAVNGDVYFWSNASAVVNYQQSFSTTGGNWTIPLVSQNVWHHMALAYDSGNVANVPVIYVDGVSQSVTTNTAPVGTVNNSSLAYILGNRASDQARNLDGKMADFTIWDNILLTAGEVAALAAGVRPYNIRKPSIAGYWPLDGLQSPEPDLSGSKNNGTLTGTALQPGPPMTTFTPRWPQKLSDVTPAAFNNPVTMSGIYLTPSPLVIGY